MSIKPLLVYMSRVSLKSVEGGKIGENVLDWSQNNYFSFNFYSRRVTILYYLLKFSLVLWHVLKRWEHSIW